MKQDAYLSFGFSASTRACLSMGVLLKARLLEIQYFEAKDFLCHHMLTYTLKSLECQIIRTSDGYRRVKALPWVASLTTWHMFRVCCLVSSLSRFKSGALGHRENCHQQKPFIEFCLGESRERAGCSR